MPKMPILETERLVIRPFVSEDLDAVHELLSLAFDVLKLWRVVATIERDNVASIGVMRKLGMRVERNPLPEPPGLQAAGILDHPPVPQD
jgi:RimJ/RimL family protein N-acetyltransferase